MIMSKVSTDTIQNRIYKSKSLNAFLTENQDHLDVIHPGKCLQDTMQRKHWKNKDLISATNMNTGYVYEILREEKRPERDKMLQFVIGLQLDINETQQMLKRCGYAQLYGKNKRDSVILFCLSRKKTVIEANILLEEYGFTSL